MSAQMTTGSTVNLGWEDGNMADFLAKRQLAIAAKGWKPLTRRILKNGERVTVHDTTVVDRNTQTAVPRYVTPGNFMYLDVTYCYVYELTYDEIVDARGRRSFAAKILLFGDSFAPVKVPSVVADRVFYVRDDWFVMDEIRAWFNTTCRVLSERRAEDWRNSPQGQLHQSFVDTYQEQRELRACTEASGRIPACMTEIDARYAEGQRLRQLCDQARGNDDAEALEALIALRRENRAAIVALEHDLTQLERLGGVVFARQPLEATAPWKEEAA